MTNILDRVAHSRREFRPQSTQEFFALQLARKLNDAESVRSYAALAEQFSEDFLVRVYRQALEEGSGGRLADRFRVALRRLSEKEGS
jgi:hypothetical protein